MPATRPQAHNRENRVMIIEIECPDMTRFDIQDQLTWLRSMGIVGARLVYKDS